MNDQLKIYMSAKVLKIAIITNAIPVYRKGFYDRLFRRDDIEVKVYCQDNIPGMNFISTQDQYPENVKIVKCLSAKKEKIVWQYLPWREIINEFDVVFVSGNPRIVSDLLFGSYLKLINKKVVLWTMAHSFRGSKFTEGIRLLWSRIFPIIFVYTDKEVEFLRDKGFKNHYILGMNNGLDQNRIDQAILLWPEEKLQVWKASKGFTNRTVIVSSARLESKNKFELVLKSIPQIVKKIPNLLWCLVGSGFEEENLKKMATEIGIENHISFVGELYDEEKLAPYFLSSQLFIHPAAIGLSMMHAFGYGLPVIIHGQAHLHGPEYGAFTDGLTGKNFIYGDINSLSDKIIEMINAPEERKKIKENVKKIVREQYNVDVMVERFITIARKAQKTFWLQGI